MLVRCSLLLALGLAAPGCGDATPLAADAGPDAGPADSGRCPWLDAKRPPLPAGQVSSDGCNECVCEVRFGELQIGCFTAFCPGAPLRCSSNADCPDDGFCHFDQGCDAEVLGWCGQVSRCRGRDVNPAATATTTGPTFCGCDGVTYRGFECVGRRWARAGDCT
jgi:hypothetical protein